jgi:hypothetical protein
VAQKRARRPAKQPPILFEKTQRLIHRIQALLGGRFITYWNNPQGSICAHDVVAFFEILEQVGQPDHIYLFLKSNGGNGEASLRIVNLIRKHCKRLTVLLPLDCASAATMIALGANEIQMGPMSYLTAVDTSLTHDLSPLDRDNERVSVSLDELLRVLRLWGNERTAGETNPYAELYKYVHPLVIGAVDRASSLSVMLCQELLSYHISEPRKIKQIATLLNTKYPSHSYPVLREEAKRIGLNVKPLDHDVNALLLELNELYSEMGQKAITDFDEIRSHSNEILNILEAAGALVYFKQDKDWFYRAEERRWVTLNDHSAWRKTEKVRGRVLRSVLHIA